MINLIWKHKEGDSESLIQIPVKYSKSVDSEHFTGGKLICNECESELKQIYECVNCGKQYRIGEIEKREDRETGVIYNVNDKKAFLSMEIDKDIKVEKEIPVSDVLKFIEIFNGNHYEIYNNDGKVKGVITKIYKWLSVKNMALLVTFGYKEKERGGVILATGNKLILSELRDYNLVRGRKQEGIEAIEDKELTHILKAITEDVTAEKYMEFLHMVAEGKKIEVKKEEKKEEVVVADFLEV